MNFTIYKNQTGEIIASGNCLSSDFENQIVPSNCSIIAIASDPINQYIENNIAVDKPVKPNNFCVFDYSSKQWVDNIDLSKQQISIKRNALLFQSDWTQIPNNPLTSEKQQQWADYRQQLRDIPTQSGYPFNVVWPTQPE